MPRYRIDIEYDGSPYAGWQRQAGHPTVQEAIERAVFAFSGETVTLFGAGRTDAGVHALGQVAHFTLSSERRADTVRAALNAHLTLAKETISILNATRVADDFDARFSAKSRHYLYRIGNRTTPYSIDRDRLWYVYRPLDAAQMHEAAQRLVGHHDFSTFRAAACQANSPMRTLEKISVERHGDEVHVYTSARSFLHNQVRSMVGSLRKVGEGRWNADKLQEVLEACDRQACGPVAPAHGLYLIRADYE